MRPIPLKVLQLHWWEILSVALRKFWILHMCVLIKSMSHSLIMGNRNWMCRYDLIERDRQRPSQTEKKTETVHLKINMLITISLAHPQNQALQNPSMQSLQNDKRKVKVIKRSRKVKVIKSAIAVTRNGKCRWRLGQMWILQVLVLRIMFRIFLLLSALRNDNKWTMINSTILTSNSFIS